MADTISMVKYPSLKVPSYLSKKMDSSESMAADRHLDCSFQLCPVPILMTEETLKNLTGGQILEVLFTDPAAKADLWAWCQATENRFLGYKDEKLQSFAYIQKKA